ncbi:MAG TPA: POTRA domain-containing protein [Longimicrobiales bacterium]
MLALCALLALAAAPARAQEPGPPDDERRGPEVEDVEFPGRERLDERLLEDAIATQETECRSGWLWLVCELTDLDFAERKAYLDSAQLEPDRRRLEELYRAWGFPDARVAVRTVPQPDGDVDVEFRIEEGEPILVRSVEVLGLETLTPPVRLREPLPLRPGDPYATPLLEASQRALAAAFAERGYPFAQVEVAGDVDQAARTADVTFQVTPGPPAVFGPVTVRAERPIREEDVRARLAYRPGERFRLSRLEETREALLDLPAIRTATVEPVQVQLPDTAIPTIVTVAPPERLEGLSVEGNISSAHCIEAAAYWRDLYFRGGPRVLSIGAGVANLLAGTLGGDFPCASAGEGGEEFDDPDYFVEAELRQPWREDPWTWLTFRGFFARESAPRAYVWRGFGGEVVASRRLQRGLVLSLGYAPQRFELEGSGLYFCGNFGACTPARIDELGDPTWLAPVRADVVWTPEGPPGLILPPDLDQTFFERRLVRPRWRPWARADFRTAGAVTGSEFGFARGLVEAATTRTAGVRFEVAGRTRLGLLAAGDDDLPPQLRFYSGGGSTVRGASQNLLGPKFLITTPENAVLLGCALETGGCPAGLLVDRDDVVARPTGGDLLWEANLEGRAWLTERVQLAAFADYGVLARQWLSGPGTPGDVSESQSLLTPGVGVRVLTPLGPVRLDAAYNPEGAHVYPLFTEDPETGEVIFLGNVVYDRYRGEGFLGRVRLHLSIGQVF